MKYILDASVYLSVISPSEVHHKRAKELWNKCDSTDPFQVPELFILEVVSGLVRKNSPTAFISEHETFISSGPKFYRHPLDLEAIHLASSIIKTARVRSADAIYLSLTHKLQGTLLTLDNEILEAPKKMKKKFSFAGKVIH